MLAFSTNSEGTSRPKLDINAEAKDEKSEASLEQQGKPFDTNEILTDEDKIKRILGGIYKEKHVTPKIAAEKLIALVKHVPLEVIKPFVHRANKKLNETHRVASSSPMNIDFHGIFDEVETEEKTSKSSDELVKESDTGKRLHIEHSILRLLYSLSSKKVDSLKVQTMIIILKMTFTKLELDENNSFFIRNIENCLTWKSRDMSISELCILLSFSLKRKTESNQNKVSVSLFEETLKNAERRWVEVVHAKDFCNLVHYYPNHVSEKLMKKLESRITDFIESMDGQDLTLVCLRILKLWDNGTYEFDQW